MHKLERCSRVSDAGQARDRLAGALAALQGDGDVAPLLVETSTQCDAMHAGASAVSAGKVGGLRTRITTAVQAAAGDGQATSPLLAALAQPGCCKERGGGVCGGAARAFQPNTPQPYCTIVRSLRSKPLNETTVGNTVAVLAHATEQAAAEDRRIMAGSGLLELLLEVLHNHASREEIVANSVRSLALLVQADTADLNLLARCGAIRLLAQALQRYRENKTVVFFAATALKTFAWAASGHQAAMIDLRVMPLMIDALDVHGRDVRLVTVLAEGVCLLSRAALIYGAGVALEGGLRVLHQTLEQHGRERAVVRPVVWALCRVALQDSANLEALSLMGTIPLLMAAVQADPFDSCLAGVVVELLGSGAAQTHVRCDARWFADVFAFLVWVLQAHRHNRVVAELACDAIESFISSVRGTLPRE